MNKFLTGALVGLAVGLLVAPKAGEDTREDIADTADKWKRKWDKMVGNAGMELDDLKKILGSEISGLKDDVRSRLLTILEESKSTANRLKNGIVS